MSKEHAAETRESHGEEQTMVTAAPARPIVSKLPMDNKKFRELVNRFVERLRQQVQAMEAAAAEGKLAELADLAHWLKGAGGTVGFDEFTTQAALLEQAAKGGREEEARTALDTIQELVSRIQIPSGEQNASPVETNAERATTDGVELAEPSAEPTAFHPDQEAQAPVVLKENGQAPIAALPEAETADDKADDSDTAFLFQEERKLEEELQQIAATLEDDLEFSTLPEEEIMEPNTSSSQPI
jgi:HPt (histidine-containing phosphotransfer) domain-containing protein